MAPLTLLDLPDELLLQLPEHIHNLEDFNNTVSSCRRLRTVFADTLPKTVLQLAAKSAPTFFAPHPHFLVLCVARQIAMWAVAVEAEREARTARLVDAFRGGVRGLLDLALDDGVEGVGLTLQYIRNMYEARFSVINPLNETIDAMIGSAWYAQPNFWNGGVEDAFTLYADVSTATMQLLLYGELFGLSMSSFLLPRAQRKPGLGIDARIEFIKYCIPDWVCKSSTNRHDGFKVEAVGPYAPDPEGADGEQLSGNQTALAHLVGGAMFEGKLWKRAWRRVLIAAGAESNEDGKWPQEWIERLQKIQWRRRRSQDTSDGGEEVGEEEDDEEAGGNEDEDEHDANDDGNGCDVENNGNEDDDDDDDDDDEQNNSIPSSWTYDSAPEPDLTVHRTDDWRFTLFWNALTQAGGLSTLAMVAQFKGREEGRDAVIKPHWKAQILELRDRVLALDDADEPGFKEFGKRRKLRVSEAPDLGAEVYWCCAGMWSGF